jgi:hypothetical protein
MIVIHISMGFTIGIGFAYNGSAPTYGADWPTNPTGLKAHYWVGQGGSGITATNVGATTNSIKWSGKTLMLNRTTSTANFQLTASGCYYCTLWMSMFYSPGNPSAFSSNVTFPVDTATYTLLPTFMPPGWTAALTPVGEQSTEAVLIIRFNNPATTSYFWSQYYLPYIFINSDVPFSTTRPITFIGQSISNCAQLSGMYFAVASPFGGVAEVNINYTSISRVTLVPTASTAYVYANSASASPAYVSSGVTISGTGTLASVASSTNYAFPWNQSALTGIQLGSTQDNTMVVSSITNYQYYGAYMNILSTNTEAHMTFSLQTSAVLGQAGGPNLVDYVVRITRDGVPDVDQPLNSPLGTDPWYVVFSSNVQGEITVYTSSSSQSYTYLPIVIFNMSAPTVNTNSITFKNTYGTLLTRLGIQALAIGNSEPAACLGPDVNVSVRGVWERISSLAGIVHVDGVGPDGEDVVIPAQVIRSGSPCSFLEAYYVVGVGYLSPHHLLFTKRTGDGVPHCDLCTPFSIHGYQSEIMRHSSRTPTLLPSKHWYHLAPIDHASHAMCALKLCGGYLSELYRTKLCDIAEGEWEVVMLPEAT